MLKHSVQKAFSIKSLKDVLFTRASLIFVLVISLAPIAAGAAGPERAARRAGEIIVRFRPGAAPLAQAEAKGTAAAPAAVPARYIPKSNFSNPGRPESLKQLDARFGVRDGRPLAAAVGGASERSARRRAQGRPGARRAGARAALPPSLEGVWLLRLDPAANLEEALEAYRKDPAVLYAEPNLEGALCYVPADPLYAQTKTDFKMIGLEQAWDVRRGATSAVEVAVIDSGVDAQHPDLKTALDLANSYNFVEHNTAIYDDIGHGTRVAGVIGAVAGNGEGIAGVAFGCKLMALDVVSSSGTLTVADVAAAVDWAVARGADVINLSLGFHAFSQTLDEACRGAVAEGVAVIAAAGNENQGEQPVYPASTEGVIGVGAVAESGARCPWSNYNGTCRTLVDLVAPGETIFSTIPNGQYNGTFGSGTSFAVPMVSGVAGLLMAKYPAQSGGAITQHLLATAAPVGAAFQPAGGAGAGLLSAARALTTAMRPELAIESVAVDDATSISAKNNGDGALDPGETVNLRVKLKNNKADATLATAVLSCADAAIKINDAAGAWGPIAIGETVEQTNAFTSVTLAVGTPAHVVNFTLKLTVAYNGTSYLLQTLNFTINTESARKVSAGNYFTPQTWTADKTYMVQGSQSFNAGLTIQPGTKIRIAPGADLNINSGMLKAEGTANQPIVMERMDTNQPSPLGPHTEAVNQSLYKKIYHVSATTGSDTTGDGSAGKPWATILKACSMITSASYVNRYAIFVAAGTYQEQIVPPNTGARLTLKDGMDLYGGFDARSWQRNLDAYPTVINLTGENACLNLNGLARVDGFILDFSGSYAKSNRANPPTVGNSINASGSPVITNNVIMRSSIYLANINVTNRGLVANNVIVNNCGMKYYFWSASIYYGGMALSTTGDGAHLTVKDNVIINNSYFSMILGSGSSSNADSISMSNNYFISNDLAFYIYRSTEVISNIIINNMLYHDYSSFALFTLGQGSDVLFSYNTMINEIGDRPLFSLEAPSINIFKNNILYNSSATNSPPPIQKLGASATVTVQHCDISGGYAGTGNIDLEPKLSGIFLRGTFTKAVNATAYQSTYYLPAARLKPGALKGCVVRISQEQNLFVIASNDERSFTVWGGLSTLTPNTWEILDYHLLPDSPCVDAGISYSGQPQTDLDGNPRVVQGRSSLTPDMGAFEFNIDHPGIGGYWGNLNLKRGTTASLAYCTLDGGHGLDDDASSTSLQHCLFQNNWGYGATCTTERLGTINDCAFKSNLLGGLSAPSRDLIACNANDNSSSGLIGRNLSNCLAECNAGIGLSGDTVTTCTARSNTNQGIVAKKTVQSCWSSENGSNGIQATMIVNSTALNNKGRGIVGGAVSCNVSGNSNGGVVGNATDCRVASNKGFGVSGSATLSGCEVRDNTGAAAVGASAVTSCTITGNGSGLSVSKSITQSYIAANGGAGITGGAVDHSTIIANGGAGLKSPASLSYAWVMFNKGAGIDSPLGNIDHAAICSNGGYGVVNPAGGKTVNDCNLYGNKTYEVYDNLNTATGGYPANTKDFRRNFWGWAPVPQLTAHPFPSVNIGPIYDLFDNNLAKGWYINYGAKGEFSTSYLGGSPGDKAPAFLKAVTPDEVHPLNIGPGTFRLVFSRAMNPARPLAVTFGVAAPYTANVVAPAPGWVDAYTWQGTFAVQSDTAEGRCTLRVAGATDTTGFVIPDDTCHQFTVETSGGTQANNGLAIGHGIKMSVQWETDGQPATTIGYNVLRSTSGAPGSYVKVNGAPVIGASYQDGGLTPNTVYYYMVYVVDASMNAAQWTPPFFGNTGAWRNGVKAWGRYE